MLTSISATERVQLWDRFNGPVDQESIKIEFFRKVHRKNPPFRTKIKLPPRKKANIPEMVKCHYNQPIHLLPSLRDILRVEYVKDRQLSDTYLPSNIKEERMDEEVNNQIKENLENGNSVSSGSSSNSTGKCEEDVQIISKDSEIINVSDSEDTILGNGDTADSSKVNNTEEVKTIITNEFKSEEQDSNADYSNVNGFVKNNDCLNGVSLDQEIIKKENDFISNMIGFTTEGKILIISLNTLVFNFLYYKKKSNVDGRP